MVTGPRLFIFIHSSFVQYSSWFFQKKKRLFIQVYLIGVKRSSDIYILNLFKNKLTKLKTPYTRYCSNIS